MCKSTLMIAGLVGLAASGAAMADSVVIDGLGGPVVLESLEMGILGNAPHVFSGSDMDDVHDSLHSSGVATDGMITFVLLNTEAGLTFAALIDDPNAAGAGGTSTIYLTTTAPSSAEWYLNDYPSDFDASFDPYGVTETVAGSYTWFHNSNGDAFAWTGLETGDAVSFNWTLGNAPGLANLPFQFVTWNGEGWDVLATEGWTPDCQFAFSFTVVPLPAALLMGAAGLGGVAALRRRRK